MNLIEAQSLAGGQSIGKIQIYPKYFALPFDKYIVFGPFSKNSKNYDIYSDVLHILVPILNKENIKIVQIGGPNEKPFNGTHCIAGQTSINQIAYLIQRSLLFFGADSFGQHLAGHYDIPLVDLIVNNYANVVRPYFGNREKQIIIEPPRNDGEKPSFSFQETPKSINRIHPEQIVKAICHLLNLEYTWPYEQIYIGEIYVAPMIISSCDGILDPKQFGVDAFIVDLTLNYNEQNLLQQLQVCPCSVITNKPLSQNILEFHKVSKRIREIVYIIEKDNSPDFAKAVLRYGIPLRMMSYLSQDEINNFKLSYMEHGFIFKKPMFDTNNIKELEGKDLNNLFFKSSKYYIGRGKVYPSKKHYFDDKNIGNFDEIINVINDSEFWNEMDSFRILQKN